MGSKSKNSQVTFVTGNTVSNLNFSLLSIMELGTQMEKTDRQMTAKYLNCKICELTTNLPDSMLMPALHSLSVLSLYDASDSPISAPQHKSLPVN